MWRVRLGCSIGLIMFVLALAGCAGSASSPGDPAQPPASGAVAQPKAAGPNEAPKAAAPTQAAAAVVRPQATEAPKAAAPASAYPSNAQAGAGGQGASAALAQIDRDIVKTAQLQMVADDVDRTIDQIISLSISVRGYILDQRTQEVGAKRTATLVLRVPATAFEEALKRLSELPGVRIDSRQIASQDVTDQLIDLESRRRNLEATEARIRSFLDQTKSVEEALRVNQQLSEVQRQIEEIRGRTEFTKNRAQFSTITIDIRLNPLTPTVTPTPTLTVTPTPTALVGWNPGQTAERASQVTISLFQRLVDLAIWLVIVGLPLAAPFLVVLGIYLVTRRGQRPRAPTTDDGR